MSTNELEYRLSTAGDVDSTFIRAADGGEECYLCGRVLAAGELYDTLFVVACLACMAAIEERNAEKNGGNNNERQ